MEARNNEETTNRRSKAKLVTLLILVLLILVPTILSVNLYYLPLNDVEATIDATYRNFELSSDPASNYSEIVLLENVTNKGIISHYVYLVGSVVFNTQPDTVFTYKYESLSPIDSGQAIPNVRVRVPVPYEFSQDSYEASCSVVLPPLVNEYSTGFIVLAIAVWLVGFAAVSTFLMWSSRGK